VLARTRFPAHGEPGRRGVVPDMVRSRQTCFGYMTMERTGQPRGFYKVRFRLDRLR